MSFHSPRGIFCEWPFIILKTYIVEDLVPFYIFNSFVPFIVILPELQL